MSDPYSPFGDDEPEDAWDPGDPVEEQITNLVRRTIMIDRSRAVIPIGNNVETLRVISELVRRARRRRLFGRELLRADQIDEDVTFVRARL